MYSGGRTLADFSQILKTRVFRFWENPPGGLRFWAWRASFRVFRLVKQGPHAPKLLWHVCFSSENTKRPVCSVPGADRTKLPFAPLRKPLAHTSPGRQSWAQIIQQNMARPAALERCAPKVSAKARRATSFYPLQGRSKQVSWCSPMKNTRATAILGRADPVSPT